jgi:hypothetical protein
MHFIPHYHGLKRIHVWPGFWSLKIGFWNAERIKRWVQSKIDYSKRRVSGNKRATKFSLRKPVYSPKSRRKLLRVCDNTFQPLCRTMTAWANQTDEEKEYIVLD